MADAQDKKWRGTVSKVLPAPIDKVWKVLGDFDGIGRQFPAFFSSCETVEGEPNQIGSVRVVKGQLNEDGTPGISANERLVALDNKNHSFTYTLEENTLGWYEYRSTVAAEGVENDQTRVNWSYELNPIPNLTEEQHAILISGMYGGLLQKAAELLST